MGTLARRRALGCFTWPVKARQTLEVYRWVCGRRPDRPDFGVPLADPGQRVPERARPEWAA
jgi:hypothetical protein